MLKTTAAAFGLALLAAPVPALAQAADDGWHVDATVYLWLTSIDSDVTFRGNAQSIGLSAGDVIDHLDFAFMGRAAIHKGRAGLLTDIVYAKLDAGESASRDLIVGEDELPANVTAEIGLDAKSFILTLAPFYRLVDQPNYKLNLLAGTRYLKMRQDLDYTLTGNVAGIPVPDRQGDLKAEISNWDFIVGFTGEYVLGETGPWFLPFGFDIGGGEGAFVSAVGSKHPSLGLSVFDLPAVADRARSLGSSFRQNRALRDTFGAGVSRRAITPTGTIRNARMSAHNPSAHHGRPATQIA